MLKIDKYECLTCRRTAFIEDGKEVPGCCGKPMIKMMPHEICLQPAHAEHDRPMEKDDACDEGRAGI